MEELLSEAQKALGYRFRNSALLAKALTHASAGGAEEFTNERLEFLGDAVLDLVVSNHLFAALPEATEGQMTHIRSAVVSGSTLARVGRELGLESWMQVDEGLVARDTYPNSIVAGCYEALVAAIYLDGGTEPARRFIMRTLDVEIQRILEGRHAHSYKSLLQERVQAAGQGLPQYEVVQVHGPAHERRFVVEVSVGGLPRGRGEGRSKKAAEQQAAHRALEVGVQPAEPVD